MTAGQLWFDVEKKNYTTVVEIKATPEQLWFDVEKKNYTTIVVYRNRAGCCGLMQKRRIIQLFVDCIHNGKVVV